MATPPPVKAPNPFFGQAELGRHLLTAADHHRLPRVMLFAGPAALGKATAARFLASYDLCQQAAPRPCGRCADCRATTANTHPELIIIDPPAGTSIGVDGIRQVMAQYATVRQRPSRWLLLMAAERLSEAAANTMLKFLEELPSGVQVLMTTDQLEELPSTLRSRATVYFWHLVQTTELRQAGRSADLSVDDIARAAGRPDWLPGSAVVTNTAQQEDELIELFLHDLNLGWSALPSGPTATQRFRTDQQLGFEELVIRELLLAMTQAHGRSLWPRWRDRLRQVSQTLSLDRIRTLAERYLDRTMYSTNIQPRLLYADLHLA